nr:thioredoxin 2 [uncultured bacterium]
MKSDYVICPECFKQNPFDEDVDFESKCCLSCQSELLPVHPIEGDTELLLSLLHQSQPILVDFWGAWSGACKQFAPLFNTYADKYRGRVIFMKVNSEEQQVLANKLCINSFPTLIFLENGHEKQRLTGLIDAAQLDLLLAKYSS